MTQNTNSSLAKPMLLGRNYSWRLSKKVQHIIIHHNAGKNSLTSLRNVLLNNNISSNYGISNDGEIALYVPEQHRAWTTGSSTADNQAVTIEVSNSKVGHPWPVSDKAYQALIRLVADIAKRNGIKTVTYTGDLTGVLQTHNMWAKKKGSSTICPGQYLLAKFPDIAKQANLILNPPKMAPITGAVYTVKKNDSFWSIAQRELGDGNKYKELAEFNGLKVNSVIHVGQKLKLPTANQRTYTVKKGDSLWLIAQRELGNGNLYPQIKTWNRLKSDHINIGDKLILKQNSRTYTVRKNDSFWSIAQNELGNGNRYKELAEFNGLKTSHVLHVGDVLKLP